MEKMHIVPVTYRQAAAFVSEHHRHHGAPMGQKFAIGLADPAGDLHGVAMCGRPVSRYLDDGQTLEVNRLCTDGTQNACSMLYGAACRIARAMGYHKVITYTLASEDGASLKASNFVCEGEAGGTHWTGKRYREGVEQEMKKRWVMTIG